MPLKPTIWPSRQILLLLVSALVMLLSCAAAQAATPNAGTCRVTSVSVSTTVGGPRDQTVSGQLCTPATWATGPHRIDVLTPGATYNRIYWDWPQNPALYSYTDKTLRAGRAIFAYDRLGTGRSSRPLGSSVTVSVQGLVLHQLIVNLRERGFAQIDSIGHSLGSATVVDHAARYPTDANRVVVTGFLHSPSVAQGSPALIAALYPAPLDPQFSGRITDPTYLTTRPDTRGPAFYSSSAEPATIAYDEGHKDVFSTGETATGPPQVGQPPAVNPSSSITAPVLSVVGRQDALFCGPVISCASDASIDANERPYYAAARNFTARGLANTGHSLPLHPSANASFAIIDGWLRTH